MLDYLITLAMRQRAAVLLATFILIGIGSWSAIHLPIDAVPDITNPQVQINTAVSSLAPEEIEKLVTFPIESEMAGLPQMTELRSLSKFGLSQVTMVFHDDVDLYLTRQLVTERLQGVLDELPPGLTPKLAPVATGLGEIFYYGLDYSEDAPHKPATREAQLMELAQIQEYQVKPLLRATPGVAEVNTSGGYQKQIVIQPDPERLAARGLSLDTLAETVEQNTRNAGGGYVEIGGEQLIIRSTSRVTDIEQILAIPLKFAGAVKPILVSDVATVMIGSAFRTGASTDDGEEALIGATIMLAGENSRLVAEAVRAKHAEIQPKLPHGVVIRTLYDRSSLVSRTIATVEKNLVEGALLVVAVLFALLGNFRAAFIVALVIPLSMLVAMTGMVRYNISGNLMSLGAIDFGLIIDGAVVMVENIVRHLGERQHALGRTLTVRERTDEVLKSAKEVAKPMFFGVLIITVVYVPILALQGIEGKMFKPMALVVMLALGGSLVLAVTLMPVLCSFLLGGKIQEKDNWLVTITKRIYTPLLQFGLRYRLLIVLPMLVLFGSSLWVFTRLGSEFIPQLDEGDFAFQLIRSSSAGLSSSLDLQKQSEAVIRRNFPEVKEIFSRIGTAEIATDPMNPNVADTYLMLAPRDTWRKREGGPIGKKAPARIRRKPCPNQWPGRTFPLT
ncbi:MAG: efflux RND transporter permease subunit, partial [Verrucomicrobiales bacterium]|nr:efflux RND transporter permease subunit [Verrucomicrobiales bacterium]